MIGYILIGIVVLVVAFILLAATRPDDFRVTRATSIAAATTWWAKILKRDWRA